MQGECGVGGSGLSDETSSLRSDCPVCSPFATCGCSNTNYLIIIIIIKLGSSDILAPLQGLNSHRWQWASYWTMQTEDISIITEYSSRQCSSRKGRKTGETPKKWKVKFAKCRTKSKCCKLYLCPICALLPSVPPCK